MADIESQVQGNGKAVNKTERPSYTRLCTCKILPICLAICIISVFSAAIVCTSLNKPIPPNAVIVISVIAACFLLLMFAGYLKIYHDKNGMGKVHPRAEQALKVFRDRLVRLFCCIDMDDYARSSNTKDHLEEAEKKTSRKENAGGNSIEPGIRVVAHRSPRKEPLQRPERTPGGPRVQPRTPSPTAWHPRDNGRYPQQDRQPQRPQPPEPQRSQNGQPPPFRPPAPPAGSANYRRTKQHHETFNLATNLGKEPMANYQDLGPSAISLHLESSQSKPWPNNQAVNHVSMPHIFAPIQAILRETFTRPPKSLMKPARSTRHGEGGEEEDVHHYHQQSSSPAPPITPTRSDPPPASATTTDASSILVNPSTRSTLSRGNSSSNSSISSPATPWPTGRSVNVNLPQLPAQCRVEQRIMRTAGDLRAQHRDRCHKKYPTGVVYCQLLRSAHGERIDEPDRWSTSDSGV